MKCSRQIDKTLFPTIGSEALGKGSDHQDYFLDWTLLVAVLSNYKYIHHFRAVLRIFLFNLARSVNHAFF